MEMDKMTKKITDLKRKGTHVLTTCERMNGWEDVDDYTEDRAKGSDDTEASTNDKERISAIM